MTDWNEHETRKVFWEDPYRSELHTVVSGVNGDEVTLAATIFYAFSGGQESDHGTIGDYPVVAARLDGRQLRYTLKGPHSLRPGDPVRVQIDWARRYRLMRLHFAAELVLELVYRRLQPIEKIGAHIAEDKARIDFDHKQNISQFFPEILEQAHEIIARDQAITSATSDAAAEVRYWEVPGFARVPCGGTHLKRTGEVGRLELKRKNVGKGKERIEIYLKAEPHIAS